MPSMAHDQIVTVLEDIEAGLVTGPAFHLRTRPLSLYVQPDNDPNEPQEGWALSRVGFDFLRTHRGNACSACR